MSRNEWQEIYKKAWDLYYSDEHVATLMKRCVVSGNKPERISSHVLQFAGCMRYEGVHPLQGGFLRRKVRTERRPGLPIEHPLIFHPKRAWNAVATNAALLWYGLRMWALAKRIKYDPATRNYTDAALAPSPDDELELLKNLVAAPASTRIEREGEPLQTAP